MKRSRHWNVFLGACLLAGAVFAQELVERPMEGVDNETLLSQARAFRARAKSGREMADKRYEEEKRGCYNKFFVNACLNDAKDAWLQADIKARRDEIDAARIEREVRNREYAAKQKRETKEASLQEQKRIERAEQALQQQALQADHYAEEQAKRDRRAEAAAQRALEQERAIEAYAAKQAAHQRQKDEEAKQRAEKMRRDQEEVQRRQAEREKVR